MLPVASFSYTVSGLSVTFTDRSTDADAPITAWSWNFGDGSAVDITQNPIHTYASQGIYAVSLSVTQGADTVTIIQYLTVLSSLAYIPISIASMVLLKLPSSSINMQLLLMTIQKWQLMLQEAPENPISDANVFNEAAWPTLFNVLISELVVYDIILAVYTNIMAIGGIITTNTSSSEETPGELIPQLKKSIETGPTKVEWFDLHDSLSKLSESQSNYFKAIFGPNALLTYRLSICALANKLEVYLDMCPIGDHFIPPIVVGPDTLYNALNYYPGGLTNL